MNFKYCLGWPHTKRAKLLKADSSSFIMTNKNKPHVIQ